MTRRHDAELDRLPGLRRRLLRWYRVHQRALPWRDSRDPYRVWVSEIMLQQTRADVVAPHYARFLERFPTLPALADAALEDVLHAWSGLGYYGRARNLHAAAQRVRAVHGGAVPADATLLRALPGIGRYTAGAIASIAFGKPEPIVDGNVARVLARLFAIDVHLDSAPAQARLWSLAAAWARCRTPGDANQALMELGATLCGRARPDCARCPLGAGCCARIDDRTSELPLPRRRPAARTLELAAVLVRRRGRVLLVRRRSGRLLRDWWEVPTCRITDAALGSVRRTLASICGVSARHLRPAGRITHGVLSTRLQVQVLAGTAALRRAGAGANPAPHRARRPDRGTPLANLDLDSLDVRWADARECRALPLSTLTRKAVRCSAAADSTWLDYLNE